ncbi:MAG TPA: hypothetical protein VGH28_00030 [Polyangiaceae bacterium]
MRFVCLAFAFVSCACGTTSPGDAGVDASGSDVGSSDAGTDVIITDKECAQTGAACQSCCSTIHPDASTIFDLSMGSCSCGDAGACETACAASLCAGQTASATCDPCVSKKCYPNAKTSCDADPGCKAWLACLVPCP